MSKFHSVLCLVAQESRCEKKGPVLIKNCVQFWADQTSLGHFLDKSGTVPSELVRIGVFSPTVVHCFGHILLSRCPIDPILFSLHLYLQGDHFYDVGWYVHHLLTGFWLWGFELGT
jgi:hypothetical protein